MLIFSIFEPNDGYKKNAYKKNCVYFDNLIISSSDCNLLNMLLLFQLGFPKLIDLSSSDCKLLNMLFQLGFPNLIDLSHTLYLWQLTIPLRNH